MSIAPELDDELEAAESCADYWMNLCDAKDKRIAELQAALTMLDENGYRHTPYMVCVPIEKWKKAMNAMGVSDD